MTKIFKVMVKSYGYALRGVVEGMKERNMKVHIFAAVVAVALSIFFKISTVEWLVVILVIFLMFTAETFNTAIESVCNENRDTLGASYEATAKARDVSAGAVLLMSIGAVIVGGIIFVPKIITFLSSI